MNAGKPVTTRTRGTRKPVESDLGLAWGPLNSLMLGLGVLLLVAGFWFLSQGSLTLAPVLLVIGYVVLIPASLWFRGRTEASGE
jgi:hypothetical protein